MARTFFPHAWIFAEVYWFSHFRDRIKANSVLDPEDGLTQVELLKLYGTTSSR